MKYTFVVNQRAVVDAGLVGKVSLQDLCLLHYLYGWVISEGAKSVVLDHRKFFWLHYERAIEELPLLFNPAAKLASRKNQLCAIMRKLRKVGLVETTISGRRLHFRLTETGLNISKRSASRTPIVAKSPSIVTPAHNEAVTPQQDKIVMPTHDESPPAIIDEAGTRESERRETPPLSPYEEEAQNILDLWNSFPRLLPAKTITPNRIRKIRKRLADPYWREHWREGIKRLAESDFATGTSRVGRSRSGPGLVLTLFNWARPRDLSHYETFEHYHETFYKHVEALSVTQFSARALDRGLSGVLVALMRLRDQRLNANPKAGDLQNTDPQMPGVIDQIVARAEQALGDPSVGTLVRQMLMERRDFWLSRVHNQTDHRLGYQDDTNGVVGLLKKPGPSDWEKFTCLNSLRDVEGTVDLILDQNPTGLRKDAI